MNTSKNSFTSNVTFYFASMKVSLSRSFILIMIAISSLSILLSFNSAHQNEILKSLPVDTEQEITKVYYQKDWK